MFNTDLQERMDALFSRLIPPGRNLHVDNLTIDVGEMSFEALDRDLADKVLEKLEQEVALLILHDNAAVESGVVNEGNTLSRSYAALFEYFLLKGVLPWWAGSDGSDSPASVLEHLLTTSPEALRKMLVRVGDNGQVRRRLVYQFTEQEIRAVISVLEPSEASFIFDYQTRVVTIQKEVQLVKSEISVFEKAVWEFIITYLLVDRGSHFNRKEFIKGNLMRLAAHFNVTFSSLLSLFASVIVKNASEMMGVDSLQVLILEIAAEEEEPESVKRITAPAKNQLQKKKEEIQDHLDLVRYFLTFGSFPWWSSGVYHNELRNIVSSLLKQTPRTFELLIRNVGRTQYTRSLIVKTFEEPVLREILFAIEPENSEYIIDYIDEVKKSHQKNGPVKAQSSELTESVWEFILEYLLVDRGSEFNRRMFIESNIRMLSGRYNLSYVELLAFMVRSIAVDHHGSSRHLTLFHDLSTLYKLDLEGKPSGQDNGAYLVDTELAGSENRNAVNNVSRLNILYFWLRTGYMPWWAGRYYRYSPSLLIDEIVLQSPAEAIVFLKYAGLGLNTRKRLVYQVPYESIVKLFGLLPQGSVINQYSETLLSLLTNSKTVSYRNAAVNQRTVIFSLWDLLANKSYTDLDPREFVKSAFINLALWYQVPVPRFLKAVKADQSAVITQLFTDIHQEISKDQGGSHQSYNHDLLDEWGDSHSIEYVLSAYHQSTTTGTGHEVDGVKTAISILDYFLKNNRLPDYFNDYSQYAASSLIKQLMLLVYQNRPGQIGEFLKSDAYRGESLLRVSELFSSTGSIAETAVSRLFTVSMEQSIIRYIQQNGSPEHADRPLLELVDAYLKRTDDPGKVEFLKQLLKHKSVAMKLALLYTNETAYELIGNSYIRIGWGSGTTPFLKSFNSWLFTVIPAGLDRQRLDVLFRAFNFMMVGSGDIFTTLSRYLNQFFRFLYEQDYQLMLKISKPLHDALIADEKPNDPVVADTVPDMQREILPYINAQEMIGTVHSLLTDTLEPMKLDPETYESEQLRKEQEMMKMELERQQEEEKRRQELPPEFDKTYITNAGLVILHPFISTYFSRLNMLDKGDFISDEMRQRGVHLLQYLAYGTAKNEEQDLVLNKLLCGMPVEEPVLLEIVLTDDEKNLSAELLKVVVSQWDKMKNTSPEGFQASFLQREGALYLKEEQWNLTVEQRGYDVILNTLPWGIGMIKLPWMPDFITVEWM